MDEEIDYSQFAGDVKGQAGMTVGQMFGNQQARGPKTEQDISIEMGFGDFGMLDRTKEYAQARAAYGSEQRKAAQAGANADFRINDARFYAGIGDYSAVESIMKSKGPALFQIGEAVDLEDVDDEGRKTPYQMIFSPKGSYSVDDGDGGSASVSAFQLARKMGVKTIPFKSGDMKAQDFRQLSSRIQRYNAMSNQLRQIYRRNPVYLGSLDPSSDSTSAKALESNIKMDYLSIMKDMKGMGGNVSDNDMAIAESMVPQRASTMFSRLGGNELMLLDNARENVFSKFKEVAGSNGIDLIDTRQTAKRRTMLKGTVERR
jgi:hypothetical protein